MRFDAFRMLALACALSLSACGDAAPGYTTTPVPQTLPSSPVTPPDALYLSPERSALVGDTIPIFAYVRRAGVQGPDTVSWDVQSPGIISIEVVEKDRIRIHALRPGQTMVTARTTGSSAPLSSAMRVNVLAGSAGPSPIVADEFRVVEFSNFDGSYMFSPQLTLRDTTGRGSSKVVALTVELPGIRVPLQCSADQVVGSEPWHAFAPVGSMEGVYVRSDRGADTGTETLARVTVRLADTLGVLLVVKGRIERGTPLAGYPDGGSDLAWCEW